LLADRHRVTALRFGLTEYYTSTRFSTREEEAKASSQGHATNINPGFSSACRPTAGYRRSSM